MIGGRNKYMINGVTAQQSRVQNLFHSVQLNVNNPHFLIMQGRITKVLNMKPEEILAMMEPSESVAAILTGAGVNDDDDNAETMKSIKAAEKAVGGSMQTPSIDSKLYQKTGTKVQNLIEDNDRISTNVLNMALVDNQAEERAAKQRE